MDATTPATTPAPRISAQPSATNLLHGSTSMAVAASAVSQAMQNKKMSPSAENGDYVEPPKRLPTIQEIIAKLEKIIIDTYIKEYIEAQGGETKLSPSDKSVIAALRKITEELKNKATVQELFEEATRKIRLWYNMKFDVTKVTKKSGWFGSDTTEVVKEHPPIHDTIALLAGEINTFWQQYDELAEKHKLFAAAQQQIQAQKSSASARADIAQALSTAQEKATKRKDEKRQAQQEAEKAKQGEMSEKFAKLQALEAKALIEQEKAKLASEKAEIEARAAEERATTATLFAAAATQKAHEIEEVTQRSLQQGREEGRKQGEEETIGQLRDRLLSRPALMLAFKEHAGNDQLLLALTDGTQATAPQSTQSNSSQFNNGPLANDATIVTSKDQLIQQLVILCKSFVGKAVTTNEDKITYAATQFIIFLMNLQKTDKSIADIMKDFEPLLKMLQIDFEITQHRPIVLSEDLQQITGASVTKDSAKQLSALLKKQSESYTDEKAMVIFSQFKTVADAIQEYKIHFIQLVAPLLLKKWLSEPKHAAMDKLSGHYLSLDRKTTEGQIAQLIIKALFFQLMLHRNDKTIKDIIAGIKAFCDSKNITLSASFEDCLRACCAIEEKLSDASTPLSRLQCEVYYTLLSNNPINPMRTDGIARDFFYNKYVAENMETIGEDMYMKKLSVAMDTIKPQATGAHGMHHHKAPPAETLKPLVDAGNKDGLHM